MHVRGLLSRRRRPTWWSILAATGAGSAVPVVLVALAVTVLYPDGVIESVGPVSVQPAVPVLLLVPGLLAVACAVSHGTWPTAVVRRSRRTAAARAASYMVVLAAGWGVVELGSALSTGSVVGGMLRNLLWLSGIAVATAALAGVTTAWLPVVVACGAAVLSPATGDPWTVYGWLFLATASGPQLAVAAVVAVLGIGVAVWDPRSPGYLRPSGGGAGRPEPSVMR